MILCCSLSHFGLKCDRLLFFCLQIVTFLLECCNLLLFCLQFVSFSDVYVDILFLFCLQFVSFLDVYVDVLFLFGEYGLFSGVPFGTGFRCNPLDFRSILNAYPAQTLAFACWQLKRPARKTKDSSGVRAHASAAARRSIRSGTPAHSASVLFCTYARAHKCNFTLKTGAFYKKGEI